MKRKLQLLLLGTTFIFAPNDLIILEHNFPWYSYVVCQKDGADVTVPNQEALQNDEFVEYNIGLVMEYCNEERTDENR